MATFFDSKNTLSANPFMYDENHRLKNLLDIEKLNPRVKNKYLHISFNPSAEDYLKLTDTIIRQEIHNMMQHMGYGNQPYFVYKQNLENLFKHLNGLNEITSKEIYDQALKIFNVEIKKSGRGHIVLVCDENGKPIRYPIRLSNFKEKPKLYLSENQKLTIGKNGKEYQLDTAPKFDKFQLAQLARDLNRLMEKSKRPDSKMRQMTKKKGKQKRY